MEVIKSSLPGVVTVVPKRFGDHRGFFVETFQAERYAAIGVTQPFVQDNLSRSSRGVLRGLHLQYPNSQSKLVTVLRGRVLDVIVDARRGSPSFGKSVTVELSEENGHQVFVPRGFAHGFVVLSDSADFFYKCDNFYSPADEVAIRWNDPALGIDWQIADPKVSARDAAAPLLGEVDRLPQYEAWAPI
jgi:dTDP-4-dehydrorhamnose 3,5-epimerase